MDGDKKTVDKDVLLKWLLKYQAVSSQLHGTYRAHEVISWLVNDIVYELLEDGEEDKLIDKELTGEIAEVTNGKSRDELIHLIEKQSVIIKQLCSATGSKTEQADCVDRQAAIDAVCKSGCECGFCGIPCREVNALKALPSTQSKAIRPKSVVEDRYIKNHFQTFPHCPKCNYELEVGDCYCKVCGCHIDWSEDDE